MPFNVDDITLDDMEVLERAEIDLSEVMKAPDSAKSIKALALILIARDNPDATIEDAGKLKLVELKKMLEGVTSDPPTDGAS